MPSISPARGARVVADTEYARFGSTRRSSSSKLSLPAPDGPETISSTGSRLTGGLSELSLARVMILDNWMVGRLAGELQASLFGARVQAVVGRASGLELSLHKRGQHLRLRANLDPSSPLVALTPAEEPNGNESGDRGWTAGAAPLLRGTTIEQIVAVPNDRTILVNFASRSAFGLPSSYRLALELEPRKSNAALLRTGEGDRAIVVAAFKCVEG